jgi:hypothetical protein
MTTFTDTELKNLLGALTDRFNEQEAELKILANYREMMGEVEKWSDYEVEDPTDILPKLKEQEKEILSLMSLRSKDSLTLANVNNENKHLKDTAQKKIDSLKEENEALTYQIGEWRKEVDEAKTIQDKLNGENINYKEILEELRDYMERIGENEVKVFDKIVKEGKDGDWIVKGQSFLTTSDEEEGVDFIEKKPRVFGEFNEIEFEKADTENDIEYFNHYWKVDDKITEMFNHRNMTKGMEGWWVNFNKWAEDTINAKIKYNNEKQFEDMIKKVNKVVEDNKKKKDLPSPLLPYPRKKEEVIGEYPEFSATEEDEEQITKDYFSKNKPRSIEAVREFVDTHNNSNAMVDYIKNLPEDKFKRAYWGYGALMDTAMDKKKTRIIGECLNKEGGKKLMSASYYLLCWDTKQAGMLIGSYARLVEHWWDEIGEWMA